MFLQLFFWPVLQQFISDGSTLPSKYTASKHLEVGSAEGYHSTLIHQHCCDIKCISVRPVILTSCTTVHFSMLFACQDYY